MTLLGLIAGTFEDFRYTDEFDSVDGDHALVFRACIGDRELEGVDVLRLNAPAMGPQAQAAGLNTVT